MLRIDGNSFWPQIFIKAKNIAATQKNLSLSFNFPHIKIHQPQCSLERPGVFNAFSFVVPDLHGALFINMQCPTSLMKIGFLILWA